jgi:hypothetical protein
MVFTLNPLLGFGSRELRYLVHPYSLGINLAIRGSFIWSVYESTFKLLRLTHRQLDRQRLHRIVIVGPLSFFQATSLSCQSLINNIFHLDTTR